MALKLVYKQLGYGIVMQSQQDQSTLSGANVASVLGVHLQGFLPVRLAACL